jgi:glycine cleavage system transcriptional repressor
VNEVAVTAVGADRPGIVAALTGVLLEIGGNLEDARAALLRGSFATVLAVAVPDDVGPREVEAALRPVADELGLGIWVGPAEPRRAGEPPPRCVLSVYGADHPGIVHGFARALADRSANVVDLTARLVGDPPIYVLGMEVELPPGLGAAALEAGLADVAREHGVEMTLEAEQDEVL